MLYFLVECNNELRIIKTMSDMKMLLTKKFGVELPQVLDELEGIDPKKLNCNEYKIYKLDSDRFDLKLFMTNHLHCIDLLQLHVLCLLEQYI